jgi:hypothetical protein
MKVFLSKAAGEQLHQVIDYLEQRWSIKVRNNFIAKLQRSWTLSLKCLMDFPTQRVFPDYANVSSLLRPSLIIESMKQGKKLRLSLLLSQDKIYNLSFSNIFLRYHFCPKQDKIDCLKANFYRLD